MYYPYQFCCTCMNKSDLRHLFEVDNDGVSHYNKLTSSIAEMNFKEMNDQRLICGQCCVTLNTVYTFRQMCLRSKTNLLSQLQTSNHSNDTVRVCLKPDIKPELIVVKDRGGSDKDGSYCLEGITKECESENDGSCVHEDATVDHMNGVTHIDVKVEDVEHQTKIEDYSEYYTEFNKIEIEEDPLAAVKEESMSDTETPQDGSTCQADTRTSEEPKGSEETTRKGSYECVICKKVYIYKRNLTAHVKSHSGSLFECEICNKGFKQKEYLTAHIKTHCRERPHECEICKKSFMKKRILIVHKRTHSSERPYECEICKKGFKLKGILTVHMETHSSDRPHECEICKKRFDKKISWTRHMKRKHADKSL